MTLPWSPSHSEARLHAAVRVGACAPSSTPVECRRHGVRDDLVAAGRSRGGVRVDRSPDRRALDDGRPPRPRRPRRRTAPETAATTGVLAGQQPRSDALPRPTPDRPRKPRIARFGRAATSGSNAEPCQRPPRPRRPRPSSSRLDASRHTGVSASLRAPHSRTAPDGPLAAPSTAVLPVVAVPGRTSPTGSTSGSALDAAGPRRSASAARGDGSRRRQAPTPRPRPRPVARRVRRVLAAGRPEPARPAPGEVRGLLRPDGARAGSARNECAARHPRRPRPRAASADPGCARPRRQPPARRRRHSRPSRTPTPKRNQR